MSSFKVPCPSCEAEVLIKNPNLVGTKVECPKCKYRFKVEQPVAAATASSPASSTAGATAGAATGATDPAKPGETKDAKADDKKTKAPKTPGKNKKLVRIGVGVGAVLLLVVVGVFALGKKTPPNTTANKDKQKTATPSNPNPNPNPAPEGSGTDDPSKEKKAEAPPKPPVLASKKVTSNLLPGQTVAVYRFNMDKVKDTPLHTTFVDHHIGKLFQTSMGFAAGDVETYIHCFVGEGREPFGVIELKKPTLPAELIDMMSLPSKPKVVKTRNLYELGSNPFLGAIAHALSARSLFGDYFPAVARAPRPDETKERPLGVCVYDTQHVFIGDYALLERFLGELDADGDPPFKSVVKKDPNFSPGVPAPSTGTPTGPLPKTPGPVPPKTPASEPPKTPAPEPSKTPPPISADQRYTYTDQYRTIEHNLKKALDDLETADRFNAPLFVCAEKFDAKARYKLDERTYADLRKAKVPEPVLKKLSRIENKPSSRSALEDQLAKVLDKDEAERYLAFILDHSDSLDHDLEMKKEYRTLSGVLARVATRAQYVSASVVAFSQQRLIAHLRITLGTAEDAAAITKESLAPGLAQLTDALTLYLSSSKTDRVDFIDYTLGGNTTAPPTGTQPPGFVGPPGVGPPGGIPGPGGSSGSGGSSTRPPGMGGAPPPGPPPTGSPLPPMGSPPPPTGGFPGAPPGFGPGPGSTSPKQPETNRSHVDLIMIDTQIQIAIDLNWLEPVFRNTIAPRMLSAVNQIKGKMALFASESAWVKLASAGPEALKGPPKAFPRGTYDRPKTDPDRLGLDYPPTQRVSLFYELLPYLGRAPLHATIDPRVAWYDPQNLPTAREDRAGAWVPELLVPYYPQSAWRATSPYAPEHTLGATNYVAIAGRGLDVARADPYAPEFKTKVGITGYNWGSTAEQVTDGLSNTIYLMQTPPGLQQPWIAGGGATVRGLDERDPMAAFNYTHPDGKGGTKPGTNALMGDGSVRWIPATINPEVLNALATRAGGEALADIDTVAPKVEPSKPVELKTDPKPAEPMKPADPKPDEKKPAEPKKEDKKDPGAKPDPKATDPTKPEEKKPPSATLDPAPPPREKKQP